MLFISTNPVISSKVRSLYGDVVCVTLEDSRLYDGTVVVMLDPWEEGSNRVASVASSLSRIVVSFECRVHHVIVVNVSAKVVEWMSSMGRLTSQAETTHSHIARALRSIVPEVMACSA